MEILSLTLDNNAILKQTLCRVLIANNITA